MKIQVRASPHVEIWHFFVPNTVHFRKTNFYHAVKTKNKPLFHTLWSFNAKERNQHISKLSLARRSLKCAQRGYHNCSMSKDLSAD